MTFRNDRVEGNTNCRPSGVEGRQCCTSTRGSVACLWSLAYEAGNQRDALGSGKFKRCVLRSVMVSFLALNSRRGKGSEVSDVVQRRHAGSVLALEFPAQKREQEAVHSVLGS